MKNSSIYLSRFYRGRTQLVLWFFALLLIGGCEIEESSRGLTGSVSVLLQDTTGSEIIGAEILVDEVLQSQRTPAVLRDIPIGDHSVTARHPSYESAVGSVTVGLNQTAELRLTAQFAPVGAIEFANVPANTVMLINALPFGTTPPNIVRIGAGSHLVSAFLPGHATLLPSRWQTTVAIGDTITLTPQFLAKGQGGRVDSLAPIFYLPNDYDSSIVSNSSFRGFVTVVTFFYYNCAPCLDEFPSIQANYVDPEFAGKVQFFGLDDSDAWTIFQRYRSEHPSLGLTFPLVWDRGAQISNQYQVLVHPANFIIDQSGRIRYRLSQVNQSILHDAISNLLAEGD